MKEYDWKKKRTDKGWKPKTKTMKERVEEHNQHKKKFYPKEEHQYWIHDNHGRISSTCCDETWVLGLQAPESEAINCPRCGTHRDDFRVEPCYSCDIPLDGIAGYNYTVLITPEDKEWPYFPMKYRILCYECAAKESPGFKKRLEEDTKNLV